MGVDLLIKVTLDKITPRLAPPFLSTPHILILQSLCSPAGPLSATLGQVLLASDWSPNSVDPFLEFTVHIFVCCLLVVFPEAQF